MALRKTATGCKIKFWLIKEGLTRKIARFDLFINIQNDGKIIWHGVEYYFEFISPMNRNRIPKGN